MRLPLLVSLVLAVAAFHLPAIAAEKLIISEFLAANSGSILDQDGDASGWIEIQNVSTTTINLGGWHLSDNAANLAQWTFPATNLGPGKFLVVFASGKNRANAGSELHTNFQLDNAGEFLGLSQSDGTTLEFAYGPSYPPQIAGVSYGSITQPNTVIFTNDRKPSSWRVPKSALDLPATWTSGSFDDSSWNSGLMPLGFDAGQIIGSTAGLTNLARGKTATQSSTLSTYRAGLAVDGNLANFTHTVAGTNLPSSWEVNLRTNAWIEEIILNNRVGCCGSRLRDITVQILSLDGTKTNFTSALLNPENILGSGGLDGPANLTLSLSSLTGGAVQGGRVRVTRTPDPDLSGTGGQGGNDEKDVLSLGEVIVNSTTSLPTFKDTLKTDLQSSMLGVNSTALLRIPFLVVLDDLATLDVFQLRMKYDDGFIAYLNGTAIAQANAPTVPSWNSEATAERSDSAALQFQDFNILPYANLLQDGINVLAIQVFNKSAANDDLYLQAELSGRTVPFRSQKYFSQPTPGAANQEGTAGFVEDTRFSVDRGFFSSPFQLEITSGTAGAEIRYTTNGTAPNAITGIPYSGPIPINGTTVIRAVATKPGYTPSNVDTHTYLFLNQVVARTQKSVTDAGYPGSWKGIAADYGMDPRITTNATWAPQMQDSLRSLPTICFSSSTSNFFDNTWGFYANPQEHGILWERPTSMEMIATDGSTEFQEDCGLRIQGGYFRDPGVTQKHSLRVLFKTLYGAGKLRHNLFKSDDAVREFDTLVLRAGANDGYAWGDAKDTEQFIRNRFGGELDQSMGNPSPHGTFVHVYFNGIYWGLYEVCERPNEDFSASYFGGDPLNWDSNNAGDVKNGDLNAWNTFNSLTSKTKTVADYQKLQGNNPDGTRNPSYPVYLDKINYIDYMIANIWGGNWDWPNKNFWFGRDRTTNSTGFKFYMWDFENTMGNNRGRSPLNMAAPRSEIESSWVGQPHYYLKSHPDYKIDFADRLQKHFFNGGTLTPGALIPRYQRLANLVELSILAETARWGDDNLSPPQDIDDWRRERDWILGTYLPQRSDVVFKQFISSKLWPSLGAPRLSQNGGTVIPGFTLTLTHTNAAGQIYFTVNGTDPRLPGGALSPSAQLYSSPIAIDGNLFLRARVKNDTNWSAIAEAPFTTTDYFRDLVVSEVMYNPPGNSTVTGDEYEFLELSNAGTNTLDLTGLSFTSGITFEFETGTLLPPRSQFLLGRNSSRLLERYPGISIHGLYTGTLANSGESITLSHNLLGVIFSFAYNDALPWPQSPDGLGFSIVLRDPQRDAELDQASAWRASNQVGGSPGAADPINSLPPILINEVLSRGDNNTDFIELYNPSSSSASISGWFLTDDTAQPKKYRIPQGVTVPAGEFYVVRADQYNPPGSNNAFSLNAQGDSIYLFSADSTGNLTGYTHGFHFGSADPGVSFGRQTLSNGEEDFVAQITASPGAANSGARISSVVISEIHYHPLGEEPSYIEIRNTSKSDQLLFDIAHPTNTWRLKGASYQFPTGATLLPDQFAIIASIEPSLFRQLFNLPDSILVFGPFTGTLQNSGELIELQKPDAPGTNKLDYITVDFVRYNDRNGWSSAADGAGPSLQRPQLSQYGNEPANWTAALPTPGNPWPGGVPPVITAQPQSRVVIAANTARFQVVASGGNALQYQWRFNRQVLPGANTPNLELANITPAQAGRYNAVVYSSGGSAITTDANLTVLVGATIATQPQNTFGILGSNATFSVFAISTTPMTYQWRFNGNPLPGATGSALTLRGLKFSDSGIYTCIITDGVGPVETQPARLAVVTKAVLTQPPQNVDVILGGTAVFSAAADGTPPLTFRWRKGNTPATNITVNSQVCFFIIPNVQPSHIGNYTVSVTNLAGASATSPSVSLSLISDSDNDGISNEWETRYGLNPISNADASLDSDNDGVSNLEEYIAGTDPKDAASYLKVEKLERIQDQVRIEFFAQSNHTYSIQSRPSLESGSWLNWINLASRPTNRIERLIDSLSTDSNRFYRINTPFSP